MQQSTSVTLLTTAKRVDEVLSDDAILALNAPTPSPYLDAAPIYPYPSTTSHFEPPQPALQIKKRADFFKVSQVYGDQIWSNQEKQKAMLYPPKAAETWHDRDTYMADQMIALYWGMKGRKIARENRVQNWYNSASMIQRNYRGRLGKKIFAIHKERVRNKKAGFLQRCWRGYRGRYYCWSFRRSLEEGAVKMKRIVKLHEEDKLWASIFDKDGDGEEDDDAMPEELELLDAALCLLCVSGDLENARLYIRDALRYYPESPRALFCYAILLHLVWDCYGFLKVPRPDILDEGLEIVDKAWGLDPDRISFHDLEVAYFQNARRMRPSDPRRMVNQAVMLHVVYGSFDSKTLNKKQLGKYWEANRRAEGLCERAIELDYSCQHPQIRSVAKVFRSLYKSKRELCIMKPKGIPIGVNGAKVIFNISVYKCVDKQGTDIDRREKLVCTAYEKPRPTSSQASKPGTPKSAKSVGFAVDSDLSEGESRPTSPEKQQQQQMNTNMLSKLKGAAKGIATTNALKVKKIEDMFSIKENRKNAKAETKKVETQADIQRYKAHLRMLNLKVNPVSREFVIHEPEWKSMLPAAIEMEKQSGRPATVVEQDALKDPMKIVAGFVATRLCIRSTYDTIENERQRILVLPQIQGIRDRAVAEMIEEYAARRLQRIFRGFQGRAQMNRMVFRKNEMDQQAASLERMRKRMAERRQFRALCACVVQARFKGILWRRRLARMQGASLVIQTCYRGFATRVKLREEQRRKLEGAKVDTVYRRGKLVSGVHLFLSVKRCGLSFKFIGRSEEHMDTFLGFVYKEQVLVILAAHNRWAKEEKQKIKERERKMQEDMYEGFNFESKKIRMMQDFMGDEKGIKSDDKYKEVKAWQYEKILNVLLDKLALVNPIKACSHDLQRLEGKKVLICDPELGAAASGHGILQFAGQKRVLNDQRRAIIRYEKNLKKTRMQQEALGLPLEKY
ncbi:hypothetical protein TL16_g11061 [Triparma laevis f. inornata]|uniref:Uncharacterized protein n=1 Tax=Triparma laevis f. inornata TaxID=1714386 RepID=A0A9W7BHR3_9STRA|nr:hypothetical protein TL16_g11061 [Triparma laevis f. inornata]